MTELHPQIVALMERAAAAGVRPVCELTPDAARAQLEALSKIRDDARTPVGAVEDHAVPGPRGPIPVRLYRPEGAPAGAGAPPLPALVYFHGGGHVVGSIGTHDMVARNLCADSGCAVASVDYRLAPEHPFPAAPEDCYAATRWLADNADALGLRADRLAVGGDSAGGNLALVVALMARQAGGPALAFQLLVYPVCDFTFASPSYATYAEGYGILSAAAMAWYRGHYLPGEAARTDWRASPLHAADLSGLPPALVITAQCDVLHDEGVDLAGRLERAGVPVEHVDYPGMMHGFFAFAALVDDGRAAQKLAAERLRAALSGPAGRSGGKDGGAA